MNKQIRQHPLGVPNPTDHLVFQSEGDLKTYKVPVSHFITGVSNNFEWSEAESLLNNYDLDDVVTRSGKWWQSEINNNQSVPGADANWTQLTYKSSWQYWAAGVYAETDVFVLKKIGNVVFIYELADVARPYISSDFNAEVDANDWVLIHSIEEFSVATGAADITFDLLRLEEIMVKTAAAIGGNKNILITNDGKGKKITALLEFDQAGRELMFENDTRKKSNDGNWNPGTRVWVSPDAGIFLFHLWKVNSLWHVVIEDAKFI